MSWNLYCKSQSYTTDAKLRVANQLLQIIGVRKIEEQYFITTIDIEAKKHEILNLMPIICQHFTTTERKNLYKLKLFKLPELSVVRCVLGLVGHSLKRSSHVIALNDTTKASKYLLNSSLLPVPILIIVSEPFCSVVDTNNPNADTNTNYNLQQFPFETSSQNSEIKCS